MTANLPQTSSKLDGPLVKQFSVFLPNKVGAMLEIVKLLSTHHTHVVALSVSESTDSAIARIIASDPYPLLIRPRGFSAIALHVDDTECASSVLTGEGFKMLSQDDITR